MSSFDTELKAFQLSHINLAKLLVVSNQTGSDAKNNIVNVTILFLYR